MIRPMKPLDPEKVACEVCLKEIPRSEAQSEEVSDYIIYYCSLDCYAKWKEQDQSDSKNS